MSMTTQPARVFPAISSHGNPAGVAWISFQARARAPGAGAGDPVQDGRRAGEVQRAADRRAARRGPEDRGEVGEQGDVAHAGGPERDRDGHRDQHGPPVQERRRARLPQRRAQGGGEPGLIGALAEQDRAGVADQALCVRGDLQGMVPSVKLHGEERSSSRGFRRGNP
jgi:hypothetical protein